MSLIQHCNTAQQPCKSCAQQKTPGTAALACFLQRLVESGLLLLELHKQVALLQRDAAQLLLQPCLLVLEKTQLLLKLGDLCVRAGSEQVVKSMLVLEEVQLLVQLEKAELLLQLGNLCVGSGRCSPHEPPPKRTFILCLHRPNSSSCATSLGLRVRVRVKVILANFPSTADASTTITGCSSVNEPHLLVLRFKVLVCLELAALPVQQPRLQVHHLRGQGSGAFMGFLLGNARIKTIR